MKLLVLACLFISELYLFHLIVFLNPIFNCSKSLLSSPVDKVTTWSFILSVAFVGLLTAATAGSASGLASLAALLVITQFSDQVKKLINCVNFLNVLIEQQL